MKKQVIMLTVAAFFGTFNGALGACTEHSSCVRVEDTTMPLIQNFYCTNTFECVQCAFCVALEDAVDNECPEYCGEFPPTGPTIDPDGSVDPSDPDAAEEEEPPVDGSDDGEAGDTGSDPDPIDVVVPDDSCVILGCPAPINTCMEPGTCNPATGACGDMTAAISGTPCGEMMVCDGVGGCITATDPDPDPEGCSVTGCQTEDPSDSCRIPGECLSSGECGAETVRSPGSKCSSDAVDDGFCSINGICQAGFQCAKMCLDGACTESRPEPWDEATGVKLFTSENGCTACRDDRILFNGKCLTRYQCLKRTSQYGPSAGDKCMCSNPHCHDCTISSDQAGGVNEVCRQCRDGWFLKNGECLETCPEGDALSGTQNLFKRRCIEPFLCKSSRIYDGIFPDSFERRLDPSTGEPLQLGCRCTKDDGDVWDKQCLACNFVAGGVGDHCLRCRGGYYLVRSTGQEAQCESMCPEGLADYAPIGNIYGKECRAEFQCIDGADDVDGSPCSCKQFGSSCTSCRISATSPQCLSN